MYRAVYGENDRNIMRMLVKGSQQVCKRMDEKATWEEYMTARGTRVS